MLFEGVITNSSPPPLELLLFSVIYISCVANNGNRSPWRGREENYGKDIRDASAGRFVYTDTCGEAGSEINGPHSATFSDGRTFQRGETLSNVSR